MPGSGDVKVTATSVSGRSKQSLRRLQCGAIEAPCRLSITPPVIAINLCALLAAGPGIWLLQTTRTREQREMAHLHHLTEQAPIDEPMHLMDVPTLRMIRLSYRFGTACLAFALLLSWVSTKL